MKRWSLLFVPLLVGIAAGGYFVGAASHGQITPPVPLPIPKEVTSYRDIVKKVLPAVVSIEAKAKPVAVRNSTKKQQPGADDQRVPDELRRFFEDHGRMPDLNESPQLGFGSGFFIDPSGVILTNFHVVDGAESVAVTLQDGRKFTSKNIRGDKRTDLAVVLLSAKGTSFPYLELGDSAAAEIGDRVLAVGAPFGLTGSVTSGIVSAKGRTGLNMNFYEDFIQTDAAINPGNSGGPLVTLDGKVVGINSAIKSRSGGFQGVGLAVASNLAKSVAQSLRSDGIVRRGYLGVAIRDLNPEVAARLNVPKNAGVAVGEVYENTPAAKGGLQAGDIITAIAGKQIKDGKTLQETVMNLPLNKAAPIDILRDGKAQTLQVTIEEQPKEFGYTSTRMPRRTPIDADAVLLDKLGLEITDLTPEQADNLGYRAGTKGVVITRVQPNSPASAAGLSRGLVIAKVDNHRVTTAASARQNLENVDLARGALLQVQSPQGGINFVLLKAEG